MFQCFFTIFMCFLINQKIKNIGYNELIKIYIMDCSSELFVMNKTPISK